MKKLLLLILITSCEKNTQETILSQGQINNLNQSITDSDGDGVPNNIDQDNNTRGGVEVDENGVMQNPIFLDENGITIKAKDWSIIGDYGVINEIEYRVVSEDELRERILNDEDVTNVCTSKINLFSWLFLDKDQFNQNISSWDTSNITATNFMFYNANSFNQDIRYWDTSNITDMNFMFWEASSFNVDIRNWNTSKVTIMRSMFFNSLSFNKDLSSWDVSNVIDCQLFSEGASKWTSPKPNFINCSP